MKRKPPKKRARKVHPNRQLRQALGLSLRDYAKTIDRSAGFVCQVENGSAHFSPATVRMIFRKHGPGARRLGIEATEMLGL